MQVPFPVPPDLTGLFGPESTNIGPLKQTDLQLEAVGWLMAAMVRIRFAAFKATRLRRYDRKLVARALVPPTSASFSALQTILANREYFRLHVRPFPECSHEFFILNWNLTKPTYEDLMTSWSNCIIAARTLEEAQEMVENLLRKTPLSNWRLTYPLGPTA